MVDDTQVGIRSHTHCILHNAALMLPLSGFFLHRRVPDRWTSASLCGTNTLEKPIDKVITTKRSLDGCLKNII